MQSSTSCEVTNAAVPESADGEVRSGQTSSVIVNATDAREAGRLKDGCVPRRSLSGHDVLDDSQSDDQVTLLSFFYTQLPDGPSSRSLMRPTAEKDRVQRHVVVSGSSFLATRP